MSTQYVKFIDESQEIVFMWWAGPAPNPDDYVGVYGTVEITDPRYRTYWEQMGGSTSGMPVPE